jgi:hypothetical protein
MAKESGLGWTRLEVDDGGAVARELKNDVTNFEFATPRAVQEITGVDKFAIERLLLLADFSITLNGVFNPTATTSSHAVLSTVASTTVTRTIGLTISGQILNNECLITDYNLTRADSGELTWQAPAVLQSGTAPTWS